MSLQVLILSGGSSPVTASQMRSKCAQENYHNRVWFEVEIDYRSGPT